MEFTALLLLFRVIIGSTNIIFKVVKDMLCCHEGCLIVEVLCRSACTYIQEGVSLVAVHNFSVVLLSQSASGRCTYDTLPVL